MQVFEVYERPNQFFLLHTLDHQYSSQYYAANLAEILTLTKRLVRTSLFARIKSYDIHVGYVIDDVYYTISAVQEQFPELLI